jgi:IS605 OrfB family transposase
MKVLKLHIESNSDPSFIRKKQVYYSYAFRKLYKHFDLNDIHFLEKLSKTFNLSKYELNCLKSDVKTKISQIQTNKENLEDEILSLMEDIEDFKNKENTRKNRSKIFILEKKLRKANKRLSKDIVFGTKDILRRISFLSNNKEENKIEIVRLKEEFSENRILPLNYLGSLNDGNSNRYFNFDFKNNTIIYKPDKKTKIELKYSLHSKPYKKQLLQLQEIKDSKLLPITVRLSTEYIYICFDEQKLNGFAFNKKACKKELKETGNEDNTKQIYRKNHIEQDKRCLTGKNENRICSIDLNPCFIGCSILEKTGTETFTVLDKFCYDLSILTAKSNKSSFHKDSKYLNSKRKHEISLIYKDIFKKIKHFNCGYFAMEDLNFKGTNLKLEKKEFNRKTKNVWNLNFQANLISKHCNEQGIIKVEVDPCYTSFIGNILYSDFDPVNASIEIGRRGMFRYNKGFKYFPELTETIKDTMILRFTPQGDVLKIKDCTSWKALFRFFKETKIIYRFQLKDCIFGCFSKNHIKSKVSLYTFV